MGKEKRIREEKKRRNEKIRSLKPKIIEIMKRITLLCSFILE
jgi:hypothetical protein